MSNIKKYIPNILTISRIIATPLIIYLGIKQKYLALIIVSFFIAFTDFLDGKLARYFNVTSEIGAKLDTIADKLLALSLLIILIVQNKIFILIFILETIIGLINIYYYSKMKIVASSLIGKIKTWPLFITIILGIIKIIVPKINISLKIFIVLTIILQIICLIQYTLTYFEFKNSKKKIANLEKEYYQIIKDILNNPEFIKRKNYVHHYQESVYDHCLRVSKDCFKIGKKLHLNYKDLAIAGLLHDFYDKPWQENQEKVPLLKKHGFVHAHQARLNANKHFKKFMNSHIEEMIETHMFPLNKKIPRSKEAWILTIVDKADSLEFLMHPLVLMGFYKSSK